MGKNPLEISRRKALSTVGLVPVGLANFTNPAQAGSSARFNGVAYDVDTFEIIGDASGQFNSVKETLVGNLRVNGEKCNMNQASPELTENTEFGKYYRYYQTDRNESNSITQRIMLYTYNGQAISGYVEKPETGKVGFVLEKNSSKSSTENSVNKMRLKKNEGE
ncbi:hypothetical protein ACFQGT_00895 [Natrialbaceae archaeon GCM10025810]|uniref:hypothetical protein n=1 Tax=Halovalidus salilacus TaxID=3075124 RepID=UPI00361E36B5